MNKFLNSIIELVEVGEAKISEHGYDELAADKIFVRDILRGIHDALVVEEYPNYRKGHCVLVLQTDDFNEPIHVLWGIPRGYTSPAVLITAYRPDPTLWTKDFKRRIK